MGRRGFRRRGVGSNRDVTTGGEGRSSRGKRETFIEREEKGKTIIGEFTSVKSR